MAENIKETKYLGHKNPLLNLFLYAWHYAFSRRYVIIIYLLLSVVANSIMLLQPLVIGRVFNSIQFSADDPELLRFIIWNFSLLIVITFVFWIFHGTSRYLEKSTAFLIRKNYKQTMFERVLNFPAEWHRDHHSGDTIDKINKGADRLYGFSDGMFMIVETIVDFVGSVIILSFFYSWGGAVVFLVMIGVLLFIVRYDRIVTKGYRRVFRRENRLAAGIHDYLTNVMTVITLRLRGRAAKEVDKRSMAAFGIFKRNTVVNELKWVIVSMAVSLTTTGVLIFNAIYQFKMGGMIVIGTLFALYRYLDRVGGAFFEFTWQYGELVERDAAVRAAEVIARSGGKKQQVREKFFLPKRWQELAIKNLYFSYKGPDAALKGGSHLEKVNMKIKRGARIALVGESGSGKSTTLLLLRGLYKPGRVQVLCNGKKLPYGMAHLWEHTTLIPQEPEIFQNTIQYNITLGISAEKETLEKVMEEARFLPVLERLKKGLKTNVMEKGVSLSGGEKQRLALARGLFAGRDSQILLLDEPTSSVDSPNERRIYENIFAAYPKKTIISSIHRLHLLENFDYIYYFSYGRVVTEGSLPEILKNAEFREVWEKYKVTND